MQIGEIFALGSAFLWAIATIIYRKLGDNILPLGINLGKSLIAVSCLGALLLFSGIGSIDRSAFLFLSISGILGITLGDTFFFASLVRLGPRLALIFTTLIPVITIILAIVILHEKLSAINFTGVLFTLTGVIWVIRERSLPASKIEDLKRGIKYAVISALFCSLGIIFCKMSLSYVSTLTATFIRQSSGLLGLIFLGTIGLRIKNWVRPLADLKLLKSIVLAGFIGAFLGTWFCLLALKYIDASIASTLNSTSPVFIVPLSSIFIKEKITFGSIFGSIVAVAGVSMILLG